MLQRRLCRARGSIVRQWRGRASRQLCALKAPSRPARACMHREASAHSSSAVCTQASERASELERRRGTLPANAHCGRRRDLCARGSEMQRRRHTSEQRGERIACGRLMFASPGHALPFPCPALACSRRRSAAPPPTSPHCARIILVELRPSCLCEERESESSPSDRQRVERAEAWQMIHTHRATRPRRCAPPTGDSGGASVQGPASPLRTATASGIRTALPAAADVRCVVLRQ